MILLYINIGTHGHFISNFVKNFICNYFTKPEIYKNNNLQLNVKFKQI